MILKMMKAGRGAEGGKKEGGGYLDDRNKKESLPPGRDRGASTKHLSAISGQEHAPEVSEIR